jgi:hypothetical protein
MNGDSYNLYSINLYKFNHQFNNNNKIQIHFRFLPGKDKENLPIEK